jgi:hypothetical protein
MPQAKPEHRPGAKIRRKTVQRGYCKATISDARVGQGFRLSLSQRRTIRCGQEVWVPAQHWRCADLPADGLDRWEVEEMLEAMGAEAARRYQAEKQQAAEHKRREMLAHRRHDELDYEIETEYYNGNAHSRIISVNP